MSTNAYKAISQSIGASVVTYDDLTGFTATERANAGAMYVTPVGANVRYLATGQAPTATLGHLLKDGETYKLVGNFKDVQFIAQSGTATTTIEIATFT